jgi:hypothetical protein
MRRRKQRKEMPAMGKAKRVRIRKRFLRIPGTPPLLRPNKL